MRFSDVTHILLTHVHLDHAGATGTLVRQYPRLKVFVHECGTPHLIDPTKLVESATRLYGDQMEQFCGEVAAVPASNIVTLGATGGRIDAAGRTSDQIPPHRVGAPFEVSWQGLARYWRKKGSS